MGRAQPAESSEGLSEALRSVSEIPPPIAELPVTTSEDQVVAQAGPSWAGDVSGGITAAVIALPLALAFGVSTFEPLGPELAPVGALAGLTAAIVGCFVASFLGGTPAQITGPTGPMTVVMSSVVTMLVAEPPAEGSDAVPAILTLMFLTGFVGGAVQVALGLMNVGRLIRYIPYPVVAGFMNGIALIILIGQVPYFLGLPAGTSIWEGAAPSWPAVSVGVVTAVTVLVLGRVTKKIPGALVGLGVGSGAYYALAAIGLGSGPVVGSVPSVLPTPEYAWRFVSLVSDETLWAHVPRILGPALALGVLGAIDSLLTSVVADVVTGTRHDSRRELVGQGCGNIASACFGGLAGAGTTVATLVNVNAGGRSRRAGMTHSVALLGVLLVAAPLAGGIPLVVLAAILVVTAIGMIDGWSRKLAVRLATDARSDRALLMNLAVVVLVTTVTVAIDLMVAVAIGMVIAALLFVSKMGRRVVKRVELGVQRRSVRERSDEEQEVLAAEGHRIAVVELDGALFFGSSSALIETIESYMRSVDYFILDAHHLSEIDGTGAKALQEIHDMLEGEGKELAISHLGPTHPLWGFLGHMGDVEVLGEDHFFLETDAALEWAENRILEASAVEPLPFRIPFDRMHITQHMSSEERECLLRFLQLVQLREGDVLIEQGSSIRRLYIPLEGMLSVHNWNIDEGRTHRLTTVGPGVMVGEHAFFEGIPHSTSVHVDSDGLAYVLELESFEELSTKEPTLTMRLLFNIVRELSARERRANDSLALCDR